MLSRFQTVANCYFSWMKPHFVEIVNSVRHALNALDEPIDNEKLASSVAEKAQVSASNTVKKIGRENTHFLWRILLCASVACFTKAFGNARKL